MSEVLRELSDRILDALPLDLQAAAHFSGDEKAEFLQLDFPGVKLDKTDFPRLLGVLKKYGGEYYNKKEKDSDVPYFRFPRVQPPISQSTVEPQKPVQTSAEVKITPEVPKDVQVQPSPLQQFAASYCDLCSDASRCGRENAAVCLQILHLQVMQQLSDSLAKLANHPAGGYRGGGGRPQRPLPQERHVEDGVSWLWDKNQRGEAYEKALEDENKTVDAYVAVKKMLLDAISAGKKGMVLEGKWCFLSTRQDWIGRKEARDFSKEQSR